MKNPFDSGETEFAKAFLKRSALALSLLIFWAGSGRAQEEPSAPPAGPGPVVATDQVDYVPGATALLYASGFQPGETVILQLWHLDGTPASGTNDGPWQAVADEAGAFSGQWVICENDCVGTTVRLTAAGQSSSLSTQTTFAVQAPLPPTYVLTDKSDYPPGSTANITGVGFQPAEMVVLQVVHADGHPSTGAEHEPWTVVADANGGFQSTWHVCEDDCVGSTLLLSAVGQTSGLSAYAFFTDACPSAGGEVDLSFDPGSAINNTVQAVALQPDGKVVIGGLFTTVNRALRGGIARLNADGSTDFTFLNGLAGVNANGEVYAVAVQADDKVLLGGLFSSVNGVPRFGIARLNGDGSLDTNFQNGMLGARQGGIGGFVHSIVVQPDGKILIGGTFNTVNGTNRGRIARLNSDGGLDTTFQNLMSGASSTVFSVALQSDGKVLIGGQFTTVNGVARTNIARLETNGSLDTGFQNGMTGANIGVNSVAVQPDGKVLIGGSFNTVNSVARGRIARLNTDGSLDTTFLNPAVASGQVLSVVVQPDGKVVIGGSFNSTVGGVSRDGVARLKTDGSLDTTFQNGMTGANSTVASLVLQPDGQVVAGGVFTFVNDAPRSRIARLNTDGSTDATFANGPTGPNDVIEAMALQSDGKLVIGGLFTTVNSVRNRIARLNSDGSLDTTFQSGLSGANNSVLAVAVQPDGKVLLAGQFSQVNGTNRTRLARLNADGTTDSSFAATANATVLALALQPDGKILVGGLFGTINGVSRGRLARLNSNGTLDTTFLPGGIAGPNFQVESIVVQPDGQILIGGPFTTVNGTARGSIARLNATDGSVDTTFQNGMTGVAGGGATVISVALQADGKVLIAGSFTTLNSGPRNNISRLNSDGSLDTGFQNMMLGASALVNAVSVHSDGKVVIGGTFTLVNGVSRIRIARLNTDGSLDTSFQNGLGGANDDVVSVLIQPDNKVLIGGRFTLVNGVVRERVARLLSAGADTTPPTITCPADQVVSTAPGQCSAVVAYPPPTASDECSSPAVSCVPPSGSTFPKGSTSVNCTATDASGNTATCSFTVTVNDTAPPTATCPAPITVNTAPGACDAVVTYTATTSDNCPGATINCVPASGSIFPKGTTTVNCTAADASGNTASCSFTVKVNDNQAPVLSGCPAPTTSFQCLSQVPFPATVTANDNCDGATPVQYSETQSNPGSSCNNVISRTWTATDASGNSAHCTQTITVNDTTPPSITCPANTTVQCMDLVPTPDTSLVIISDNCDSSVIVLWESDVQSNPDISCNNVITRTYRATDDCGNMATCTQTITVNDTMAPVLSGCPAPTASTQCLSQVPPAALVTASDNCNGSVPVQFTETQSNPGSSCNNVISRTWTATDDCGNTTSCSQTITVNDTEPPTATCPAPIVVSTSPGACNAVVTFAATANDNCSGATIVCTPPSGSTLPKGINPVTCTATDDCGNTASCSFTITVNDTETPTATCPAPITVNTAPGVCDAVVTYTASASDNCPGATIACAPPSGSTFPKGATTVNCSATDTSGNTANCSFTVTVNDNEPPTATCPAPMTVNTAPGACDAVVTYTATASDNCPGASISCVPASGSTFPKGTTMVNCAATDASGNSSACSFTVTVNDSEAPTISCPPNQTVNTDPNSCEAVVTYTVAAADNCPGVTFSCSPPSGSAFPKGSTTVNCLASDTSDNTATCSFTVTVNDAENPTINCPQDLTVVIGSLCSGAGSGAVTYPTPTTADNCAVASVACVPASGSIFPPGATTVTCTVTDTSGNTADCTFTVTLQGQAGTCETINAYPDRSRVHFNNQGQSEFAFFRGNLETTGGNLAPDFRVVPGNMARGALKVTIGNTVVYCKENLTFTVHDNNSATNDREKWTYNASPLEKMFLRWKDDQEYIANRDPNLPSSVATGNKNVGNLETRFIHDEETRFRYEFKNTTKPITITVDGLVLLTVKADGSVTSPFPHWKYGKAVEVLFPDRLVPGNSIAWYADGDLSNNGGLPENLIYQHDASANGTATDTYFNAGGRFFIKVPVPGVNLTSLPRSASVQFTLGEPGVTLVGCGDFTVPSYTVVGKNWKFNDGDDDCESEE